MEIPLDPEIEAILRQKVEAGEYPNLAVLVEEALFLLVHRDWERTKKALLNPMGKGEGLFPTPWQEDEP